MWSLRAIGVGVESWFRACGTPDKQVAARSVGKNCVNPVELASALLQSQEIKHSDHPEEGGVWVLSPRYNSAFMGGLNSLEHLL